MKYIPYGKQYLDHHDFNAVSKSLKQDLITSGESVKTFEKKCKNFFRSKYAISCNNATSGLHLAFKSINLKKNDVVIMPSINFISSYNICKNIGAKIYLSDVDPTTGQMTPEDIKNTIKKYKIKNVKLIVTMYLGGYPENVYEFYKLKKKLKCYLIEDACHALGATYNFRKKKIKIGSCYHSDVSVFSLHPVKPITAGEGGIVTTNSKKISDKVLLLRSHGILRKKKHWEYDVVLIGHNYRLSDINCSLAKSQLNKIKKFLQRREEIFRNYKINFLNQKFVINQQYNNLNKPSYHLYILSIDFKKLQTTKKKFMEYLLKYNIKTQFHYIPIYRFKIFGKKFNLKNFIGAEKYYKNSVSIPIFHELTKKKQNYIINKINNFFKKK